MLHPYPNRKPPGLRTKPGGFLVPVGAVELRLNQLPTPAYECRPEKYMFTMVKLKTTHR